MKQVLFTVVMVLAGVLSFSQKEPQGLHINDKAPDFAAVDQNGKMIQLSEQLKKGPVVLVFYRGYWCPFCNKQLKKLEDSLSLLVSKGAYLIAVTAEKPENISRTVETTRASYPVLFDEGLTIMKKYDVAYMVDDQTITQYKKYGIDFTQSNGIINGNNLPVPAMYVINKKGTIVFRHFDKDITKRATVAEILPFLD